MSRFFSSSTSIWAYGQGQVIDGGSASSQLAVASVNGGTPSTTGTPMQVIYGGTPGNKIVLTWPTNDLVTYFTSSVNGGTPSMTGVIVINGGTPSLTGAVRSGGLPQTTWS